MQPYGKAYILCEFDNITYIESVLEESMYVSSQINSSLKYLHLTWVNAGITTRDGLEKIHEGILLESGITDEGKKSIGKLKSEKKFDEAHLWLQKKRFFTEINKNLSLQHKGKVVAAFAISPRTTLYFLDIKRKLMAYTKSIDPPTLFAILFCADEFCSVVRTDEKIDANILYNGKKFVNIQVLEEIIGEGKKESIKILKSIKAFSYVFHSYIMERYGMDPHITLKYMRLTGGEITILQSIGNRMILSAHMLLGEFWKYGRPLRVLKKGISLSPPIFDEDVYHLIQIPGCGIKTSTLLAECKFNSLEDVISSSSNKIENTVRKHVRRKNSHINKLNSLKKSGAKVKNWGLVSRKKIEKIQLTIITRGGVDTSNLPPNLLNNVKNKQQKLNI